MGQCMYSIWVIWRTWCYSTGSSSQCYIRVCILKHKSITLPTSAGVLGNRCQLDHWDVPSMKNNHILEKLPDVLILHLPLMSGVSHAWTLQCIQIYQLHNWHLEYCQVNPLSVIILCCNNRNYVTDTGRRELRTKPTVEDLPYTSDMLSITFELT